MCFLRKLWMNKKKDLDYVAEFEWDCPKIKLGEKMKVCRDSMCETIGGCGCPDADNGQFVKIWNNRKCKYVERFMSEEEAQHLMEKYNKKSM
jgi:hypothetical protein